MVHVLQNMYNFVVSRCCFAEEGKEMYKDSNHMCRTIVLLNKPLVWQHFYCHCHCGLLKLPNITEIGPLEQFSVEGHNTDTKPIIYQLGYPTYFKLEPGADLGVVPVVRSNPLN